MMTGASAVPCLPTLIVTEELMSVVIPLIPPAECIHFRRLLQDETLDIRLFTYMEDAIQEPPFVSLKVLDELRGDLATIHSDIRLLLDTREVKRQCELEPPSAKQTSVIDACTQTADAIGTIVSSTTHSESPISEAMRDIFQTGQRTEKIAAAAVLLRHETMCLKKENETLRQTLQSNREELRTQIETSRLSAARCRELQTALDEERHNRSAMIAQQIVEMQTKCQAAITAKQQELDVARAKLALLEQTLHNLSLKFRHNPT